MHVTEGWRWHSPGAPKRLTLEKVNLPALGDRDVLIENHMIAFNPVDWKLITQKKENPWKAGHIPGVDGMGIISAMGNDLRHLRVGARVAYHTNLKNNGSFARHTIVPGRAVMAVPAAVSDVAAASFPCPGLTAWQALAKLPNMSGEALLVTAAAGSVGRYVTQLALQRNIRVFAVQVVKIMRGYSGWVCKQWRTTTTRSGSSSCARPTAVSHSTQSLIWSQASRQRN